MAAKGLHTCLKNEEISTTDSDGEGDLLGLTRNDSKESCLSDDSLKKKAAHIMKGTIEQVKLEVKAGKMEKML